MNVTSLRPVQPAETDGMIVPAHGRGRLKPFVKGVSGNPSGSKGPQYHEVQRILRAAAPDAARRLIELMGSDDERIALMAADRVLERAWGRMGEAGAQPDPPPPDPAREAARLAARARLIAALDKMAVPEPLPSSTGSSPLQV